MNLSTTLKLAFRNILRNRRRSILTIVATVVSVALLVVASGMIGGIETSSVKSYIRTRTAHLKIYAAGYPYKDESPTLDQTLSPAQEEKLAAALHGMTGVKTAPRILFPASLIKDGEEAMVLGAGVDPTKDPAVLEAPGPDAVKLTDPRSLLLGTDLAQTLKLQPGDTITVSFRTKSGTIFADDFTVAGLVDSGNPEVDSNYFFMSLAPVREYLEMPGEATEWDLLLDRPSTLSRVQGNLTQALGPDFQVISWRQQLADVLDFFAFRRKAFGVINGFMFIMAVIIVANTMLMAVYERFKEIGTLMALGMKRRQILQLFAVEGSLLGILGGLAGILIGGMAVTYLGTHGIDISLAQKANVSNIPLKGRIYADAPLWVFPAAVLLAGLVAGLAALWPARRAASLDPSVTLRKN